jgi:GDPmannose 4,6-dehydratase
MKKVALVTGVAGQDGSFMAEFLLNKGYRVVGLIRRNATRNLGNAAHLENDIDIEEGDITDTTSMMRIIQRSRPNEIYNLAAMSHVGTSFEQPIATLNINTLGVVNILEAVKTLGYSSRIFQASTSELWGDSLPPQNEDTIMKPRSPYAIAKLAAHWFIRMYREAYGMYCCAGITHNHECFFSNTPVILKHGGEISIQYVRNLVPNRTDISKDNSKLTKDYSLSNVDIWNGTEFVSLRAVSRRKLSTLENKNRSLVATNSKYGVVYTTPNHLLIDAEGEKKPVTSFKKGDRLKHGRFPASFTKNRIIGAEFAKLLGMLCADGFVGHSIRLINKDPDIQNIFIELASSCFNMVGYTISKKFISGFGGTTQYVNLSNVPTELVRWIRNMLYDEHTKHKKIPSEILNSPDEIKQEFLNGYYIGDGLKAGGGSWEFQSFKSNSPLLCQGLLYLFSICCPKQDFNINTFIQNDRIYNHINLNAPKNNNCGSNWEKDPLAIKHIIWINKQKNQHVYDIETASGTVSAGIGTTIVGNSERRGPLFVTRKISLGVANVLKDPSYRIKLGNIDAFRDWGFAKDFVEGFWMTLQQPKPDDFVFATGEMHSVSEFVEKAFAHVGIEDWSTYVDIDRFMMRPLEVESLCGDPSKAKEILGWEPKVKFEQLVKIMVDHDCKLFGVEDKLPKTEGKE